MSDYWDKVAWFTSRHIFEARPVYHRQLDWDLKREDGTLISTIVACGIVTRQWDRASGEEFVDRGMLMRRDFADRIGRPCRKCWPEAK